MELEAALVEVGEPRDGLRVLRQKGVAEPPARQSKWPRQDDHKLHLYALFFADPSQTLYVVKKI